MDSLLNQVERYARRYALWQPGEAIVVGVSGGPDSLCLLHVLHRLAPALHLRLHVAHLNHGLRGAEAEEDAQFVAAFAAGLGLPCTVGRADVRNLAAAAGLSLEEAARQARYRFLAETAQRVAARMIAVGHNADDQAETVLMHFVRGSGLAGLRGMLPKTLLGEYRLGEADSRSAEFSSPLWLIRPLLAIPRADIEAYCAAHDLTPRFDRSNEDTTFFRNRLRHELMPILQQYNPAIRDVLAHTAEVLAGDHQIVRAAVDSAWQQTVRSPTPGAAVSGEIYLDLAAWRELPLGLQRAVLREAIHRLRASLRNINWVHVERAVWLCREGATGQRATLVAGLEVEIGYRTLRIGPEGSASDSAALPAEAPLLSGSLPLAAPGETELTGGWRCTIIRVERAALPEGFVVSQDPWTACLDAAAVGWPLILRPRRAGDRFQPQGMAGHTMKLNEFMINVKLPRERRSGWPLLVSPTGIAWVGGLRVAEWAAVRDATHAVWIVRLRRDQEDPK